MKLPGVYVEFRGDYTQLEKDAKAARAMVGQQARGMSDALNNAISPNTLRNNVNKLVSNLGTLNRASSNLDNTFSKLGVELGDLRRNTGLTAAQFDKLQQKMLKQQVTNTQERALKNIARQAGLTKKEVRELGQAFGLSAQQIKKVNQQLGNTPKKLKAVNQMAGSIKANLAALAGIYLGLNGIDALGRLSDEYTNINSKIKLVTESQEEFDATYKKLFETSQRTGTVFEVNAKNFANLALALQDTDLELETLLSVFEDVNKSLIVSGASIQEINSFMLQFKQALGANRLQGDEFRGMMESNAYWAGQFAKALDTDIAGLYEMKEAGLLTTQVVIDAHSKMSKSISADFSGMTKTIGRARNELSNALKGIVADIDRQRSAGNSVAQSISNLATIITDNKDTIASVFDGLIQGSSLAIESVGRVARSIQGLAIVAASEDKSLLDWVLSSPEDMKRWQDEIKSGAAFVKDQLVVVRREIEGVQQQWGDFGNKEERLKKLRKKEEQLVVWLGKIEDAQKIENVDTALLDYFGELDKAANKAVNSVSSASGGGRQKTMEYSKPELISFQSQGAVLGRDMWAKYDQGAAAAKERADVTLAEMEASTADAAAGMSDQWVSMTTAIDDAFVGWGSSYAQTLTDMVWETDFAAENIIKTLGKMATQAMIQYQIIAPIMQGYADLGGIMGIWSSFTAPSPTTLSTGAIINPSGAVFGMHTGGIVGSDATFSRTVPTAVFNHAPKYHTGGIIGPGERPIIAKDGEGMFTPEQMRNLAPVGSGTVVNLTINGADDAQVEQKQNDSGGVDLEVWIGGVVAQQISTPGSPANSAVRGVTGAGNQFLRR